MKKNKFIIITALLFLVFLGFFIIKRFKYIEESKQDRIKFHSHIIKENVSMFDFEDKIKNVYYFIVQGKYYAFYGEVNNKTGFFVIDLTTGKIHNRFEMEYGVFTKGKDNYIYYYTQKSTYKFKSLADKPVIIKSKDNEKIISNVLDFSNIPSDYGIKNARVDEYFLYSNEEYVVTSLLEKNTNKNLVSVYDRKNGKIYYEDNVYDNNCNLLSAYINNGYIYLLYSESKSEKNTLVQLSIPKKKNIKRAHYGKYPKGITIVTGEDVKNEQGNEHEIVTDEKKIMYAKKQVQSVIDFFPDGFFDEMLSGEKAPIQSIVIYLRGGNKGSSNDASGYATYNDSSYIISIDISGLNSESDVSEQVAHEFMHCIDYYMQFINADDKWEKYLPKNYKYVGYDNYSVQNTNDTFSFYISGSKDKIWFIDNYSKISKNEDKAVTFQDIYGGEYYSKFPHLNSKSKYLLDMFYYNFKSVRNSDKLPWKTIH